MYFVFDIDQNGSFMASSWFSGPSRVQGIRPRQLFCPWIMVFVNEKGLYESVSLIRSKWIVSE